MEKNWLDVLAMTLIIIVAINSAIIAYFNLDVVSLLFGTLSVISRIIYAVVGIAGLYAIVLFWKLRSE